MEYLPQCRLQQRAGCARIGSSSCRRANFERRDGRIVCTDHRGRRFVLPTSIVDRPASNRRGHHRTARDTTTGGGFEAIRSDDLARAEYIVDSSDGTHNDNIQLVDPATHPRTETVRADDHGRTARNHHHDDDDHGADDDNDDNVDNVDNDDNVDNYNIRGSIVHNDAGDDDNCHNNLDQSDNNNINTDNNDDRLTSPRWSGMSWSMDVRRV